MKEKTPLSVKLEPELHQRLEECSTRTRIKKYTLALLAIEAAVEAIEKNDYHLVVPIQFDVAYVPTQKSGSKTSYPSPGQQPSEPKPAAAPKKKTGT